MTSSDKIFARFPKQLRSRTLEPFTIYELATDHYAVHEPESGEKSLNAAVSVLRENDKSIGVFSDEPGEAGTTGSLGPVYKMQNSETKAVPTGLVFVRFKTGVKAAERETDIRRAGFEIADLVEYAPEAAWVKDPSMEIAKALASISALEKLPDVENVEPQMLMPRVSR